MDAKTLKMELQTDSMKRVYFSKDQIQILRKVNIANFLNWFDKSQVLQQNGKFVLSSNHSVVLRGHIAKDISKPEVFTKYEQNPCSAVDFCQQYLQMNFYQSLYSLNAFVNRNSLSVDDICNINSYEDDGELPF